MPSRAGGVVPELGRWWLGCTHPRETLFGRSSVDLANRFVVRERYHAMIGMEDSLSHTH
jgi:hypothetical protein